MSIDMCPACGYPTIGRDVCSFCRPLIAGINSGVTPASDPIRLYQPLAAVSAYPAARAG
jgi:hypothetical protein